MSISFLLLKPLKITVVIDVPAAKVTASAFVLTAMICPLILITSIRLHVLTFDHYSSM